MPRLFGTDGVRGLANSELTPELAMALSGAAARVLADRGLGHRPVAVVGRDPRASGEMLEAAVTAGLTSAGADVLRVGILPTPANAQPDGLNINDRCGCTHPDPLRKAVLEQGATVGIAHDGDADRCLAVDASGEVVDGDQIMAILALAMIERAELVGKTLVTTVMSN